MVTALTSRMPPRLRPLRWAASLGHFLWRILCLLVRPFRQIPFKLALVYTATSLCAVILGELVIAAVLGTLWFGTDLVQDSWANAAGANEYMLADAMTTHPGHPLLL